MVRKLASYEQKTMISFLFYYMVSRLGFSRDI